jgi:hypothetical protein
MVSLTLVTNFDFSEFSICPAQNFPVKVPVRRTDNVAISTLWRWGPGAKDFIGKMDAERSLRRRQILGDLRVEPIHTPDNW